MTLTDVGKRTWLLIGLGVLGAATLGAELVARRVVDAGFLQQKLIERLGTEELEVSIGSASFSLLARRLEARDLVIGRRGRATFTADRFVAAGLPLLRGGDGPPKIGELTIERPLFYYHPDDAGGADPDRDPVLRLGMLRIEQGTALAWRRGATDGPSLVLVRDLEVDGNDVSFDGAGRSTDVRSGLAWSAGPILRVRADGLTRVSFDSLRASGADSTFMLWGGRFEPTMPDAAFFDHLEVREDRIRAAVSRIETRGLDFDLWPRDGLVARSIVFDTIAVDVLTNRRIPSGPSDPWLPAQLISSFEGRLEIDTIAVRGRIEYRDLPVDVAEPGLIAFENLEVRVEGISNAPDAGPLVVDARLSVFGAPAETRIEIPLDADQFRMSVRGRVGGFDLARLNDLTIPLEGIEIQDGRLEALRYDVVVDGPAAGGTVWAAYRDLDIQMVDRRTGKGSLMDDLKSFVANTFTLRGENMPASGDEGAKPGAVEYAVDPRDSFFTRVWAPIRSGLMAVAKK